MKRLCVLSCLVGILAGPAVQAAMQVTLYQDLSNYSYSDGGEFSAVPNAGLLSVNPTLSGYTQTTADPTAPHFQTFCIETGEFFYPGSTYNVTISQDIQYDGGMFPGGSPITMGTAWLYSQFASGALSGSGYDYSYGGGRTTTAGDLQQAIWYLQGEETSLINGGSGADGTTFYNAAVSALGGTITNAANGAYGVVVLNLWVPNADGSNGAAAQDQLMVVPETSAVPEPGVVSFGLLLLLPFGAYKVRALIRRQKV